MQKSGYKFRMAACAALTVILFSFGVRPANAVLFDFAATCDACSPILGPVGSPVTGTMDIAAAAVVPAGNINGADILSLSLNFATLGALDYVPAFFGLSGDPVGNLNPAGDAVERLSIFDSIGQFFTVDLSVEGGNASWTIFTTINNEIIVGSGTQPTFNIAPPSVPEPGTMAMFLFGIGSLVTMARRRRRMVVSK